MNFRLSDELVEDIRATAAEGGMSLSEIAERFGTSKQHVSRLVRGEQRQPLPEVDLNGGGSVVTAVEILLEAASLSPAEDVIAATALALAEKLDAVRLAPSASAAMAAPGLARALSETLLELRGVAGDIGPPRIGSLRGEEAVLVAREMGHPDPETVDFESFDRVAVIQLARARRLARVGAEEGGGVDG